MSWWLYLGVPARCLCTIIPSFRGQKLLQMCVAIPVLPYRRLIGRQTNPPLAAAA
ncbi:hypothetical protein NYE76_23510 [Paenibacillus sp. FSL M7-0831]